MARIRTLKPEFFRSRSLARVSLAARLTFQGLWCEADDAGRGIADPRLLKGALWPLDEDVDAGVVGELLDELEGTGHIFRYVVDGETYYVIVQWEKHQASAYRRGKTLHPAPPLTCEGRFARSIVQDARPDVQESAGTRNEEGNEELGTGNEEPPPSESEFTSDHDERGGVLDEAARLVAWQEVERRGTVIANPPGYVRSRVAAIRKDYEEAWMPLLDRDPSMTAAQLVESQSASTGGGVPAAASPVLAQVVRDRSCPLCDGMGVVELDDGTFDDCKCKRPGLRAVPEHREQTA